MNVEKIQQRIIRLTVLQLLLQIVITGCILAFLVISIPRLGRCLKRPDSTVKQCIGIMLTGEK